MRHIAPALFLLIAACGGKAIDDPNYDGPGSGDGDGDGSPSEPTTYQTCQDVCEKWDACTPGADGAECNRDCINGYNQASAIGCGDEYDRLLNCYSRMGVCAGEIMGCEFEAVSYTECFS